MKGFILLIVMAALSLASLDVFANGGSAPGDSSQRTTTAPSPSTNMHPQSLQGYIESRLSNQYLEYYNRGFESVCRSYSRLSTGQKRVAVSVFITAIAKAESGLNSFTKYLEPFGVWSLGLFQTSYEDTPSYRCPYSRSADKGKADSQKTVFRSENQVQCFLNISHKLYANPGQFAYLRQIAARRAHRDPNKLTPMEKLSAYWSIFRASNRQGYNRFYAHVKNYMPGYCN